MNMLRRHRLLSCKAGSGFHEKRIGILGILEKIHWDIGIGVAYCGPSYFCKRLIFVAVYSYAVERYAVFKSS
jgi:hypothetical protein